jgi:hypothetical protein
MRIGNCYKPHRITALFRIELQANLLLIDAYSRAGISSVAELPAAFIIPVR